MTQFVSYAQNFEDVMLRRALRDVEHGFYIDVGAQREESDSVTKAFSLAGWRGINIEPHPAYFQELESGRPDDINLDIAIGEKEGSVSISFIDDTGLSTADSEIASQHAAAGYAIRTQEVSMLTLDAVWRRHVPADQPVHFLKVDVEGFEQAVIAGNDWNRNRPWIVLVEATLPNSQVENHASWEPTLLDAGYTYVYADGLNRFYVAPEHAELAASFKYPPNVFDSFVTVPYERARQDVTTLRQSIAESEEARAATIAEMLVAKDALAQARDRESNLAARLAADAAARLEAESAMAQARDRASSLLEENLVLQRSLNESHRRIELAEEALAQGHGREAELQRRLDSMATILRGVPAWFRKASTGKTLRNQARRVAKAAWWAVTPWRMPARLRFIRERKVSAASKPPARTPPGAPPAPP